MICVCPLLCTYITVIHFSTVPLFPCLVYLIIQAAKGRLLSVSSADASVASVWPGAGRIQAAIDRAVREAEQQGVSGRDVTPFILARVNELTGGASLRASILSRW